MMRHAILLSALALLAIVAIPSGRADEEVYSAAEPSIYTFKGGNGYFYVFYRDTSNNIRYQYYDGSGWSTSSVIVSGNVVGEDDYVVGFYGHTYMLLLYKSWSSGTTYTVRILKCTVAAPLSCGSPTNLQTVDSADELTLTYNPAGGRWYLGYIYYDSAQPGYIYRTFHSTDGSTWTSAQWSSPTSPAPANPFRFQVAAIPGTTDAFVFFAGLATESYYRYCIVILGTQSCATLPNTIGSKTEGSASPPVRGIPSTSSGRAEIFTNNQWFRCTSASCSFQASSTWVDPVSLMREGSSIYMFYISMAQVKRRAVTTVIGSEITYLIPPTGTKYAVAVPVEAATPRPVAYLSSGNLYVHTEPTIFTKTLSETMTGADTLSRRASYIIQLSETLTAEDIGDRVINYVKTIVEPVGLSDYFEGSPSFTLPELVTIFDSISYEHFSQGGGEGGGVGGGPAAPSQPIEPPSVEIPVEPVPAQPVALGSAVVAGVLLAVFAAFSLRGRRSAVSVWRRRRARARRIWR